MFTAEDKLFARGLGVSLEDDLPDFVAVCRYVQKAKPADLLLLCYVVVRRFLPL